MSVPTAPVSDSFDSPSASLQERVQTKIVATVGPACSEPPMLAALAKAGVDVFRINMAHGDRSFHDLMVQQIRELSRQLERPLAILVDLAGPKIRLGELAVGELDCQVGSELTFHRGDTAQHPDVLVSNYDRLIDELDKGDMVMLADGAVALEVVSKSPDEARCRVVSGGVLRSRQGINVPGAALSVPALTDEDKENARWAATREIDYLGMSFVRTAEEVQQLKHLLAEQRATAQVVAKIEKREALKNLESVVAAADAVMVARGDLGVEIDVAQTPVAQKQIIEMCSRYMKPVIVATQMLDSMQRSSRPTRAEVSDVANAILDGADACMLSGETAIGQFPLESVTVMNRVMSLTEQMLRQRRSSAAPCASGVHAITAAVISGASHIAQQLESPLVVVYTRTGGTARVKSKQPDTVLTIGVSDSEVALRRMCLYRGIMPLYGAPVADGPALRRFIESWAKQRGLVKTGDRLVFITGSDVVQVAHNVLVVHEVT